LFSFGTDVAEYVRTEYGVHSTKYVVITLCWIQVRSILCENCSHHEMSAKRAKTSPCGHCTPFARLPPISHSLLFGSAMGDNEKVFPIAITHSPFFKWHCGCAAGLVFRFPLFTSCCWFFLCITFLAPVFLLLSTLGSIIRSRWGHQKT
jgi:hypothetical protein